MSPRGARTLVTGGAGFIGTNLVDRLLGRGEEVTLFDDLSRAGSAENLAWLQARHGRRALEVVRADVRDAAAVVAATRGVDRIAHLAGQVAVTSALADPRADFEANALGTLNVLEAARGSDRPPVVLYASTNKVYGSLDRIPVLEEGRRYRLEGLPHGVSEEQPLEPCSPYGCSKAAGDFYTRDYHRMYGLRTVVLRQSCIHGPRQLGAEEQGWVTWIALTALEGRPVRIFGDGKQVRDLLAVADLLDAYDAAFEHIDEVAGEAFNIGGGPERSLSVWQELGPLLGEILGRSLPATYHPWRPGDQRVFVSDVRKAERLLGWRPRTSLEEGLRGLVEWLGWQLERRA